MKNPVTPLTPEQTAAQEASDKAYKTPYWIRVLKGADEEGNIITGGMFDETWSARFARWVLDRKGMTRKVGIIMCTWLGWIQPNHDVKAVADAVVDAENIIAVEEASGAIDINKESTP